MCHCDENKAPVVLTCVVHRDSEFVYSKTRLSVAPGHCTLQEGLSMVSQMMM